MIEPAADLIRRVRPESETGIGVFDILRGLVRNRALVREMARREMTDVHAGQSAGAVWLFVHPLLQFVIYAFLFTVVFQVRIAGRGPSDYLVYLFAGLTPWLMTQDVIARAPNVLIANATIVKKVMFPLEVLVAKTVLSSVVVQSVLLVCAIGFIIFSRGGVSMVHLLLPPLLFAHLLMMWGLALLLSSLTPYLRDIPEIVRMFLTVNVYLLPILYLPDMVPRSLQIGLLLNPFSHLVWCYQDVLYFNAIAHPWSWLVTSVFTMATLVFGSYVFVRLRHYFSSVL